MNTLEDYKEDIEYSKIFMGVKMPNSLNSWNIKM